MTAFRWGKKVESTAKDLDAVSEVEADRDFVLNDVAQPTPSGAEHAKRRRGAA
jgi:hypothetical protein